MSPDGAAADLLAGAAPTPMNAAALRGQIDSLKAAEELAHNPIAQRRAQTLHLWRQHGLQPVAEEFFTANPTLFVDPEAVSRAHVEAERQGLAMNSPEYFQFIASHHGDAPAPAPRAPEPRPEPRLSQEQSTGRRMAVSAPPSRTVPRGYSDRDGYEFGTINRITLSPQEREAARLSGVDEETYARGKLEMLKRKAAGDSQQ